MPMTIMPSSRLKPIFLLFCGLGLLLSGCGRSSAPSHQEMQAPSNLMIVLADTLNLRECPGKSCQVVALLYRGERVKALRQDGVWMEIETKQGRSGWVASRYLGDPYHPQSEKSTIAPAQPEEELAAPVTNAPPEINDELATPETASPANTPPEISEEFGQ
jgi:hypothetical protein